MTFRLVLFSCLLMLLVQSCEYYFDPETSNYENRLVVHGLITNELQIVKVTLSRTTDINATSRLKETGALVSVKSRSGELISFIEMEEGTYYSLEPFEGTVGEEYKLSIRTNEGKRYESDYVMLNKPQEIGELSYEYKQKETTDIDRPVLGCQFYVDVNVENDQRGLFRYEMEEIWEIFMPKMVTHFVVGEERFPASFDRFCWKYNKPGEFNVLNTEQVGSNNISQYPLFYVSNETDRLRVKYCLNVKQFTLTDKTYSFWKSQFDNIGQSTMYSRQPYQVVGNIKNVNDPNEIVLGVFEASGVSSKRIFVKGNYVNAPSGYSFCEEGYMPSHYETIHGYYIYQENPFVAPEFIDEYCANCKLSGGVPGEPDYWE